MVKLRVNPNGTVQYTAAPIMVPTGALDAEGRVLFSPKMEYHGPGSILEIDDPAVVRHLLEAGVIEVLDAGWSDIAQECADRANRERNGPATAASETQRWPKPRYQNEVASSDVDGLV